MFGGISQFQNPVCTSLCIDVAVYAGTSTGPKHRDRLNQHVETSCRLLCHLATTVAIMALFHTWREKGTKRRNDAEIVETEVLSHDSNYGKWPW